MANSKLSQAEINEMRTSTDGDNTFDSLAMEMEISGATGWAYRVRKLKFSDELASMTRMFNAACSDLGRVSEALGIEPNNCGAIPLLQAIGELKSRAAESTRLNEIINQPMNNDFLRGVSIEAEHQRQKWGEPHDRSKSSENWFWLVGYLAGKCLRACITGDKNKAQHHTISSAAALFNWHAAISLDESGSGIGADVDIKPRAEGGYEGENAMQEGNKS